MAIDWLRIFEASGVDYVESGPNVARGHIAIHCPFCGPSDPSQHMSVALNGQGWRCFRNHDHRGKSHARLLAAAAGISLTDAHRRLGTTAFIPTDWFGRVEEQFTPRQKASHRLELPAAFKPFRDLPSARPYVRYLEDRGFAREQIWKLTDRYDVRYCTSGPYQGRIIFPVYYHGRLVSWTGRTISRNQELRYRALGTDPEDDPRAIGPLPDFLLWYDDLIESKGHSLILTEGPFDALKVAVLGRKHGVVATCFFTSSPSDAQIELLHGLLPRFDHHYLMLDSGTLPTALKIIGRNIALGLKVLPLPKNVKDPGDLSEGQLLRTIDLHSKKIAI